MKFKRPFLDSLSFEVRYAHGHLYLDRCGQTMVDIEKKYEGWAPGQIDINFGAIEKFDDNFNVQFNVNRYNFFAKKPHDQEIEYIAKTAKNIWKVVRANLNLDEFARVGCRLQYLLATKSIDNSNKLINQSSFTFDIPSEIKEKGYSLKTKKIDTVLVKDDIEYQIKLGSVIQSESVNPSSLVSLDPRSLPKGQREAILAKLEKLRDYSAAPMYAVHLDVDCAQFHPESFDCENFICNMHKMVNEDFYYIVEELWER